MWINFLLVHIILSVIFILRQRNIILVLISLLCIFMATALIFFIMGSYFLAYLILLIYAGAVCILFLFATMILSQATNDPWKDVLVEYRVFFTYENMTLVILIITLILYLYHAEYLTAMDIIKYNFDYTYTYQENINLIAYYIYIYNPIYLVIVILHLLITMVGVLSLTLSKKKFLKIQSHLRQISR